jgi:hypothetical protein
MFDGLIYFVRRNDSQTVWLTKNAGINARPTPDLWAKYDEILRTAGTEPLRPLWSEDRHDRDVQQICKMHGTTVVADQEPTV